MGALLLGVKENGCSTFLSDYIKMSIFIGSGYMSVSNDNRSIEKPRSRWISTTTNTHYLVRIRIKLSIPQQTRQAPILARLITDYGLSVNIFCTLLDIENQPKQLDLELQGTIAQVNNGLLYLKSLNIVIKGKPNPDGDSWYY